MFSRHTSVTCTIGVVCLLLLAACTQSSPAVTSTPAATPVTPATPTVHIPTPTPTKPVPTPVTAAPQHYTTRVVLRGVARPDDLAFDMQGRLLFSDAHNGTVSRLNTNGTITILLQGLAAPEGLVVLSNGTLLIAEQGHNRILALASGATTPTVVRTLPGTPSTAPCKDGVDGIALDATTNTLIIPDSPTGEVYRMSIDGKTLTLLASGIVRPVGAAVDAQGTIYVTDECGGALWIIAHSGKTQRIGGFGMLDDVVLDTHGNVLVTDLAIPIHALIRMNIATGKRETLASQGFIEPQGLVMGTGNTSNTASDTIWISDDYANIIVEYVPA